MYEFEVQSMTCGGCASRVTRALTDLDAMAKVKIDLVTRKVQVQTLRDRNSIVGALTKAGYPPQGSGGEPMG